VCINESGDNIPLKVSKIQSYEGLDLADAEISEEGDIIVISGIDDVMIGDTIM